MVSTLEIEVVLKSAETHVRLSGTLDGFTTPQFDREVVAILEQRRYQIVLDMSRVCYISSAGAGSVVNLFSEIADHQGTLTIIKPSQAVHAIFELVGLTEILTFVDAPGASCNSQS